MYFTEYRMLKFVDTDLTILNWQSYMTRSFTVKITIYSHNKTSDNIKFAKQKVIAQPHRQDQLIFYSRFFCCATIVKVIAIIYPTC